MSTPEKCPKCKAVEGIVNTIDFSNLFGITNECKKEWFCTKCNYNFNNDEIEPWWSDQDLSKKKLSYIADIIMDDWRDISSYAQPYVNAMMNLDDITDSYGSDDAVSIVGYFLNNAKKWRGITARKIKMHLKKTIVDYYKSKK